MSEVPVKSAQDALDALRLVVAGHEDFVYRTADVEEGGRFCVNFEQTLNGWQPSCIVGHVLHLWGLPQDCRNRVREEGIHCAADDINNYDMAAGFKISYAAISILSAAQGVQDQPGHTWGQALALAEAKAAILKEYGEFESLAPFDN
jgi:hypothetical protein